MNFLVTNDDGIESAFLAAFVAALLAEGHRVAVVAPTREQSMIGAAKSRHRAVQSQAVDHGFGCPAWTVDGTPSDCVNIALAHLLPRTADDQPAVDPEGQLPVQGVVSGINTGFNVGLAYILASGTIAGAWEGALHGYPAAAFSQDLTPEAFQKFRDGRHAADPALRELQVVSSRHAASLAGHLLAPGSPAGFLVHNVNFPISCRPDTPLRQTVPAQVMIRGLFSPAQDDGTHHYVFNRGQDVSPPAPLTDRACIDSGAISHSILDYKRLGHAARTRQE